MIVFLVFLKRMLKQIVLNSPKRAHEETPDQTMARLNQAEQLSRERAFSGYPLSERERWMMGELNRITTTRSRP